MTRTLLLLYKPDSAHVARLNAIGPEWKILYTTNPADAKEYIMNAEVIMGNHHLSESIPFNNGSLKWIQTNSIGIDFIKKKCGIYLDNILLTNARGVFDDEISEHTIALILLLQRKLHFVRDAQNHHCWHRLENLMLLKNKNVLIVGYGNLGKAIHQKLSVFGCKIFGINTSIQSFFINHEEKHWREHLPYIDILILSLPFTNLTRNYIGEIELKKLPKTAFVVNVGRAETLDEQALFCLLRKQEIAGAALDVLNDEPLKSNHDIWDIQNLFISPHMARSKETEPPYRFEKLFEENFERYLYGKTLLNIVDIEKGY